MAKARVIISGNYELIDQDYESEQPLWQVAEDRRGLFEGAIGLADLLEWCQDYGGVEISIQLEEEDE